MSSNTLARAIGRGFRATENGLVIEGSPTFASWASVMETLRVVERGVQFAIGDAIIYGEDRFGEEASQVLDAANGWSLKTLQVYRWLAKSVPPGIRRMDRLGVRHHMLVATLPVEAQRAWLTKASGDEDDPWTVSRLAHAIRDGGDAPAQMFWVLVSAKNEQDQVALQQRLEAEGRSCKAVVRRQR